MAQVEQAATEHDAHGFAARCLLRAARSATLATQEAGQPHAALVTPACDADGSVVLLLSGLSAHARQLRAEPRCALLVCGPSPGPNPQEAPRLCVEGVASLCPEEALRAMWLLHHPYAAPYAGLADFTPWRVRPTAGRWVGGFGQARKLTQAALMLPEMAAMALKQASSALIAHCNTVQREALTALAQRHGHAGSWELRWLDADGALLGQGKTVVRLAFAAPATSADGLRTALGRLLDLAPDRI